MRGDVDAVKGAHLCDRHVWDKVNDGDEAPRHRLCDMGIEDADNGSQVAAARRERAGVWTVMAGPSRTKRLPAG